MARAAGFCLIVLALVSQTVRTRSQSDAAVAPDIARLLQAGDAFKEIPRLAGEFDFVFLDAWKRDYKRFFDMMLPRLSSGGLFLAHNVLNKRREMPDFMNAVRTARRCSLPSSPPRARGCPFR